MSPNSRAAPIRCRTLRVAQMTSVAAAHAGRRPAHRRLAAARRCGAASNFSRATASRSMPGRRRTTAMPMILPSEARSLADMTRAAALAAPGDPRAGVLRDGLLRLGDGDGWGSTNANSAADPRARRSLETPAGANAGHADAGRGVEPPRARRQCAGRARGAERRQAPLRIDNSGAAPGRRARRMPRYQPDRARLSQAQAAVAGLRRDAHVLSRAARRCAARAHRAGRRRRASSQDRRCGRGEWSKSSIRRIARMSRFRCRSRRASIRSIPISPPRRARPRPRSRRRLTPTWRSFDDDRVFYAYDALPKGNYRFAFRAKAQVAGAFTQPPGEAETMYQAGIHGASAGQRIIIAK